MYEKRLNELERNFALVATWQIFSTDHLIAKFHLFIRWSIDPTADGA